MLRILREKLFESACAIQINFFADLQTSLSYFHLILNKLFCVVLAVTVYSCADDKNENFELALEDSLRVTESTTNRQELRCDAASDLGCGRLHMTSGSGNSIAQDDAFVKCTSNSAGDLLVSVTSSSLASTSSTQVTFSVHQNLRPQGFANCDGVKPDSTSPTGFKRNSCDVLFEFAGEAFSATPFERCLVNIESSQPLVGSISCEPLRTAKKLLFVSRVGFQCEVTDENVTQLFLEGELP